MKLFAFFAIVFLVTLRVFSTNNMVGSGWKLGKQACDTDQQIPYTFSNIQLNTGISYLITRREVPAETPTPSPASWPCNPTAEIGGEGVIKSSFTPTSSTQQFPFSARILMAGYCPVTQAVKKDFVICLYQKDDSKNAYNYMAGLTYAVNTIPFTQPTFQLSAGHEQIIVNVTDSNAGDFKYNLCYGKVSDGMFPIDGSCPSPFASLSNMLTPIILRNLTNDVPYHIKVQQTNGNGDNGPWSDEQQETPSRALTPLGELNAARNPVSFNCQTSAYSSIFHEPVLAFLFVLLLIIRKRLST